MNPHPEVYEALRNAAAPGKMLVCATKFPNHICMNVSERLSQSTRAALEKSIPLIDGVEELISVGQYEVRFRMAQLVEPWDPWLSCVIEVLSCHRGTFTNVVAVDGAGWVEA